MSYQVIPTYEQPLTIKGQTHTVWYRFLQGLYKGTPPSSELAITPTGSPFTYTAPSKGFLLINGGTVTAVQFIRSLTTLTGQTQGLFPVSQGDQLVIMYTAQPSLLWVAQ